MGRAEDVAGTIETVRSSKLGLHWTTLAKQRKLLDELGTDDPKKGVELLIGLLQRLDDDATPSQQDDATVLRWVMAVDCPPIKNVTARREAVGTRLFMKSHNTVLDAEKRAIPRLVTLILKEADKRAENERKSVPFHDVAPVSLLDTLDEPEEVIDHHAEHRRRQNRIFFGPLGVAVAVSSVAMIVLTLWGDSFITRLTLITMFAIAATVMMATLTLNDMRSVGRLPESRNSLADKSPRAPFDIPRKIGRY